MASILQGPSFPTPSYSSMRVTFNDLPSEIVLEIIPHVIYTPQSICCLCLTCRRLNSLIKHHEHGLVRSIRTGQFNINTLALFPGLQKDYDGLKLLYERLETMEDIHNHRLRITSHGRELQWLKGRWEQIHKAGLLLLYRLQDAGNYDAKVQLLQSLPATSLACLLFKLISSIKILRVHGPEPINASYAREDVMARSDVELAFEELLLQHGPDFFVAMLKAGWPGRTTEVVKYVSPLSYKFQEHGANDSCRMLQDEISSMEARQQPSKPATLISVLRRALATQAACEVEKTVTAMWEILARTGFDDVDDELLGCIVSGGEVTGGLRRIF